MFVAAITGWSGSGKTTLLVALIELYRHRGLTVGAIKHTHHEPDEHDRGDTARFAAAGASPVILAGDNAAVIRNGSDVVRVAYTSPMDLLVHLSTDVVLVEGFKQFTGWPRIELHADRRLPPAEAADILDRIWRS